MSHHFTIFIKEWNVTPSFSILSDITNAQLSHPMVSGISDKLLIAQSLHPDSVHEIKIQVPIACPMVDYFAIDIYKDGILKSYSPFSTNLLF